MMPRCRCRCCRCSTERQLLSHSRYRTRYCLLRNHALHCGALFQRRSHVDPLINIYAFDVRSDSFPVIRFSRRSRETMSAIDSWRETRRESRELVRDSTGIRKRGSSISRARDTDTLRAKTRTRDSPPPPPPSLPPILSLSARRNAGRR